MQSLWANGGITEQKNVEKLRWWQNGKHGTFCHIVDETKRKTHHQANVLCIFLEIHRKQWCHKHAYTHSNLYFGIICTSL